MAIICLEILSFLLIHSLFAQYGWNFWLAAVVGCKYFLYLVLNLSWCFCSFLVLIFFCLFYYKVWSRVVQWSYMNFNWFLIVIFLITISELSLLYFKYNFWSLTTMTLKKEIHFSSDSFIVETPPKQYKILWNTPKNLIFYFWISKDF